MSNVECRKTQRWLLGAVLGLGLLPASGGAAESAWKAPFSWRASAPLVAPHSRDGETYYSVKDPTVVRNGDRWHVFCTVRGVRRSHQIEYLSFTGWDQVGEARRAIVPLSDGYYCAPQVFFYTPRKKWYLIYQVAEPTRTPELQPAYSTTETLDDPESWTRPELLFDVAPQGIERWIDFWVICDDANAYLFFTSLDGKFWRAETARANFPRGWSQPKVVLEADIFEASHTYRVRGLDKYVTLVEAQGGGRRYYQAYLADRLDGEWKPLADTQTAPFAGAANVAFAGEPWAESISHGELLRASNDERLEVDADHPRFLFQGALDREMAGKKYGEIPWRLGILERLPQ